MTDSASARSDPRRIHRRRRLADGARVLPVLGAVLFVLPLLWQGGDAAAPAADPAALRPGARTAWVMGYLFAVWLGLAVLSGVLSRHLSPEADAGEDRREG